MTHAIVPLNIKVLRVNNNDQVAVTPKLKGRVAAFELMPYDPLSTNPSIGSAISQSLSSSATPIEPLKAGMHLHWELPDVYRRGTQDGIGGEAVFPHAPNTWLVTRYLSIFDPATRAYGPVQSRQWIVESDYISNDQQTDSHGVVRPTISVPLPTNPSFGETPYKFMGRVVDYDQWQGPAAPENYLPHYSPNYLTSIGFVGPSFSSYYPECTSVFGFWDHFEDVPQVSKGIKNNTPLQFRASYQVTGWVRDEEHDVLNGLGLKVKKEYDAYVEASIKAGSAISSTPADELARIAKQEYRLEFNAKDIEYTVDKDKFLVSLDAPERGICNGIVQEVVWDMLTSPGSTYFLSNPKGSQPNPVWTDDKTRLAIGNTTVEGLSALIKEDMVNPGSTPQQTSDYEVLLDALQLGLLHELAEDGKALIDLEEALHTRSFSKNFGGYLWSVEPKDQPGETSSTTPQASRGITLPLALAEILTKLNRAQKIYDQERYALGQMREQLFMDWLRFIEAYVDPSGNKLNVSLNDLIAFIDNDSEKCELAYVVQKGKDVGVQRFQVDKESGLIAGLDRPEDVTSLAGDAWHASEALRSAIKSHPEWEIRVSPGPSFWTPTDPVLVLEGDRLEPVRRNGKGPTTPVRLTNEILAQLDVTYQGNTIQLVASDIDGQPTVTAATPMHDVVSLCIGEAFVLVPMLAANVADAVGKVSSTPNPAVDDRNAFITTLQDAQGGLSPLDPGAKDTGLYSRLHVHGAKPIENAVEAVTQPQTIQFTFTNPGTTGWTLAPLAWSAQTTLPAFDSKRVDPFLPVFLIWTATLDPLKPENGTDYSSKNLISFFRLDKNAVDYTYPTPVGGKPAPFTTGNPITYSGSVVLSRQPTRSLTAQIEQYEKLYPNNGMSHELDKARALYEKAHIMSQGIGDFSVQQVLKVPIARVPVEDLVTGNRESITSAIAAAATAATNDNWYSAAFNKLNPISKDLRALGNFGPLRAGFGQVMSLEIIDAFGQRLTLKTKVLRPDGSQNATPSHNLKPAEGDTEHEEDIFYPPRLLPPSRVWFKWLSATFDSSVGGFSDDFVEMNAHPATSPVCGWIVPNHLDVSLFFYNSDGAPFGSFGVEHGALVYRTRAGNTANPKDLLELDIGPECGPPLQGVNQHVFDFMWHVQNQTADFLADFMESIASSETHMNPANYAQDVGLSVLMGRPLALARSVLALETAGGVVPVSQADTSVHAPFSRDVLAGRFRYPDRQKASSAALESVEFPVRLGSLENIDDGLIGYLIDGEGTKGPYGTLYSSAAPSNGGHGVERPKADTIKPTLNADPISLTLVVDPRGPVHATTGILPVQKLEIPSDQYSQAMGRLELTFFTHPVLREHGGLKVPLPEVAGYDWGWVQPGLPSPLELEPNAGTDVAVYNFTPQKLFEGWVRLAKSREAKGKQSPTSELDED